MHIYKFAPYESCYKMAVFWVVAPCSLVKFTDVSEVLASIIAVALGGLVVSVLATGPKVAGSNPAEDDGF
jgi:hypothetical protein